MEAADPAKISTTIERFQCCHGSCGSLLLASAQGPLTHLPFGSGSRTDTKLIDVSACLYLGS
jgi:hypothetical protein